MCKGYLKWSEFLEQLPLTIEPNEIEEEWMSAVEGIESKIIVLDDDPTGVQTVHSVPVYTSWDKNSLDCIMKETSKVVYILTNSRALTSKETQKLHSELTRDLLKAAKEANQNILLVSRGDSTLRGHYPIETEQIYNEYKKNTDIDGEILIPAFFEGGRYTFNDIHYVKEGDYLVPAGQTEFAKDSTFGYKSSNLTEWIEEKTNNRYSAESVKSIPLELLRNNKTDEIADILTSTKDFGKVIINCVDYTDLKVFFIGLSKALNSGKNFIFRTAASFVRVAGGITPKPLLNKSALNLSNLKKEPGLIIVGSFVQKTTRQLEKLKELSGIAFIEWDVAQTTEKQTEDLTLSIVDKIENAFSKGLDACIYTSREYRRVDFENELSEKNLVFSTTISNGLVNVVKSIKTKPRFIIAKGGITSSDIGVKGLNVKRAMVLGQIQPGVPVWETGDESLFPGIPYIIFPGNVGDDNALKNVVEILRGEREHS